MLALKIYRLSNFFYKKNCKVLSKILDIINYYLHNSIIPGSCKIGKKTKLAYGGIGVVIHSNAEIGEGCLIGQGITIGGRNGEIEVPKIGDNTYIGAGSRILGKVLIEGDTVIGPNSVVLKNISRYSVVAGVPAKVINEITEDNYKKYFTYCEFKSYKKTKN